MGLRERKWTGDRKGKKITLCALRTEGAVELMGDRREAVSAGRYYVHNWDRVGGVWGNVESGNCYQAEDQVPSTAVLQEGDESL